MIQLWTLVGALLALGLVYVVLPTVLDAFRRFRRGRVVRCPETHAEATVHLDARHAAWTTAIGPPVLRIRDCSLWPERQGCSRVCLKSLPEGRAEPATPRP
ncbi:MAG: hypothetical protein ACE5HK_04700 [Candidatus Methylomirabilales bacterium]